MTPPDLQPRRKRGGAEFTLQSSTSPESDYRIFYRTYARDGLHDRRPSGAKLSSTQQIDRQLRSIELMRTEPGARRALSLARWIRELISAFRRSTVALTMSHVP
jgi:hypothetical protein